MDYYYCYYHVRCKTVETSIFNVNGDSLPGPLIIGTFEKRAPGPGCSKLGSDNPGLVQNLDSIMKAYKVNSVQLFLSTS